MAVLLEHLAGNRLMNFSLFRPHLYAYDNGITYKRRHLLTQDEISMAYNHISQANIYRYIVGYAHLELVTTGQQRIKVHWLNKRKAEKLKKMIDEKIFQSHKRNNIRDETVNLEVKDYELSLQRLNELVSSGKISEHEFNKRKKELLKKHY